MKHIIRIVALTVALTTLLTVAAGCKSDKKADASSTPAATNASAVNFEYEYAPEPITASANQYYFMYNPDRGFRTHNVIRVHELTEYVGDKQKMMSKLSNEFGIYFQNLKEPCSLSYCYIYFTPWVREDLPEEALEVVRSIFEYARLKKIKLLVSFAYNDQYHEAWYSDETLKQNMSKVCADEKTMLRHIDQLAPIVSEYKDCCFSIKNGFIGFVGEWAYPYQYPEVDYDKITMAIVDKLCAPNGLYFSHRLPRYTASVEKNYPEWENVKWIGFNNCAFYGEQTRDGWDSEGFQLGDADGWWEYMCENGAYAPSSGEMFTSQNLNDRNVILKGKEAILELAHHWHTVFSFYHGKYDCVSQPDYTVIMETWERQEINKEWLDAQGIIYDPNWFVDDNGNPAARNCYEFIRDHLGYKIVAENVKLKAADGKIKVDMAFKNYGFSAAFNLTSGFAILDEKFNVVSEVNAGDPTKWYSHDPENWKSTTVLDHSISAELPAPTESGTYYVAFYLKNTMGVGAQLSNKVQFEKECNILYSFTV